MPAAQIHADDRIGVRPGTQHPDAGRGAQLPPPNPDLGDAMRNRNWTGREQLSYYEMKHAPQPWQYTQERPHALYGGGSGSVLQQYMPPPGPPTGFAVRQAPVTYSQPGVSHALVRPTFAYNRIPGRQDRRPTMYAAPGTWPAMNYPQGGNTYIPSWEATGLILKYTRDPVYFRINRYVKEMKVPRDQGYYLALNGDDPYRVVSINDYVWDDSADAPGGRQERQAFGFMPYRTARYCYPFSLGRKSVVQAEWPILAEHAAMQAAKAMTVRTQICTNLLTTSANWTGSWGSNTGAVAGQWSQSTVAQSYIQNTLNAALIGVEQASGGIVTDEEALQITINPVCARNYISVSPEYKQYIQGSPDALAAITDQRNPNRKYGLAPFLYGLRLVVENAIIVTSPKPANSGVAGPATTRSYIWPNSQAIITSKPEGIIQTDEQTLDFSTTCFRFFEQMSTESKSDPDNRREIGRVVEDFTCSIQAPQTGYQITNVS